MHDKPGKVLLPQIHRHVSDRWTPVTADRFKPEL